MKTFQWHDTHTWNKECGWSIQKWWMPFGESIMLSGVGHVNMSWSDSFLNLGIKGDLL